MKPNRNRSRSRSAKSLTSTDAEHADHADGNAVDADEPGPFPATTRAFIGEYVVDFDAKAAAIRAGIAARNAAKLAGDLLRDPAVAKEIRTRMQSLRKTIGISVDEAMLRLSEASRDETTPLALRIRIWSSVVDRAARTAGDGDDGGTLLDWLLALPKPGAPPDGDAPGVGDGGFAAEGLDAEEDDALR